MSCLNSHGRVVAPPLYLSVRAEAGKAMEGRCFSVSFDFHLPQTAPVLPAASFRERSRGGGRYSFARVRASVGERSVASPSEESFYELLGIAESVGISEIKQAYKQMARKYHPDVSPPDRVEENTRRFIRVQEAYETLCDPGRRALYDRNLARGLHLAFSVRRRFDDELEQKSVWRNRWQDQLEELKTRSSNKASEENMSWGARMRQQRNQSPEE